MTSVDVLIIGGGVAGRSAGIFTARHGLNTTIVDSGVSILRRNAHLENYPGFPAGVNSRLLLAMMGEQAEAAGCNFISDTVKSVTQTDGVFKILTSENQTFRCKYVIAATKNNPEYLKQLSDVTIIDRGKEYIETDERGRTGVDGLYAAGRLAQKPHQTIINAGHGAEVANTVLEDDERPYYHDWVAPNGYFTGRGREIPPGCEEISTEERLEREQQSIDIMQSYFSKPYPEDPDTHPSLLDGDDQ